MKESREIEIGENLGCFLVILVVSAASVLSGATCGNTDESVDCVKAGGQWRTGEGCESGHGHCERK
jgi:hypothetical protein